MDRSLFRLRREEDRSLDITLDLCFAPKETFRRSKKGLAELLEDPIMSRLRTSFLERSFRLLAA